MFVFSNSLCECLIFFLISHLLQLNQYIMNIKTNLIEECVNFVDTTNKRNENLWLYIIMLTFIVFILILIIIFLFDFINE